MNLNCYGMCYVACDDESILNDTSSSINDTYDALVNHIWCPNIIYGTFSFWDGETDPPTNIPSINPTNIPSNNPTNIPTIEPTIQPTENPQLECHDGYSCALSEIQSDSTEYDSAIECYGFGSCAESNFIKSTGSADIECFGSFSCYYSQLIHHTDDLRREARIECMHM